MTETEAIRIVVYREQGMWVSQCLEYDIRAQAENFEELLTHTEIVIEATRQDSIERHGTAFAYVEPAPQHFHDLWERRSGYVKPREPARPSPRPARQELTLALCA